MQSLSTEEFDWPAKIAFALSVIEEGTAEEIASTIVELEGDAAQGRVAEVTVTVGEFLEALQKDGRIKYGTTSRPNVRKFKLIK